MTTILIETQAFLRLESELRTIDSTLEFILMQPDGSFTFNGKNISVVDAQPEIAWLNVGLARAGMTQTYVKAVLATGTVKWLQTSNFGRNTDLRGDLLFLENLRRYLADKPLLNEVPVRPS
jgi:hypothetical protein